MSILPHESKTVLAPFCQ